MKTNKWIVLWSKVGNLSGTVVEEGNFEVTADSIAAAYAEAQKQLHAHNLSAVLTIDLVGRTSSFVNGIPHE